MSTFQRELIGMVAVTKLSGRSERQDVELLMFGEAQMLAGRGSSHLMTRRNGTGGV